LEDLFEGREVGAGERSDLVKLASQLIIEEALESEADDRLGRGYYVRSGHGGHRNGYRKARVKSAEGTIEFAVPQVRGLSEPYRSEIRAALAGGCTEELERLGIEMYARGLSVRDIEAAFTDRTGRCVLTRTAVSQLTERLWADYQAFAGRDLSEHRIIYLFIDGIAERLHLGQPREAVLAAWGITEGGQKVLLGLAPGAKEDTVSCREYLRDLKARSLVDPILVITDGAPGLIRCGRGSLPEEPASALPRSQGAKSRGKGASGAMAGGEGSGDCSLPGGESHAGRARA
jgi:transposase-like protein